MLARRLQKGLDMRCLDLRIIVITTAAAAMTLTASATASAMAQAGNLIAPAASAVSRPAGRGPNLAASREKVTRAIRRDCDTQTGPAHPPEALTMTSAPNR